MLFYDYLADYYKGSADEINIYYKTEKVCKDIVLSELKNSNKEFGALKLKKLFASVLMVLSLIYIYEKILYAKKFSILFKN